MLGGAVQIPGAAQRNAAAITSDGSLPSSPANNNQLKGRRTRRDSPRSDSERAMSATARSGRANLFQRENSGPAPARTPPESCTASRRLTCLLSAFRKSYAPCGDPRHHRALVYRSRPQVHEVGKRTEDDSQFGDRRASGPGRSQSVVVSSVAELRYMVTRSSTGFQPVPTA